MAVGRPRGADGRSRPGLLGEVIAQARGRLPGRHGEEPFAGVSRCIMTRMQRGCAPFMSSSRAHSSGTSPKPTARAAVAGNIEWMSSVAVNSTEMMTLWSTPLRSTIAANKAWVARSPARPCLRRPSSLPAGRVPANAHPVRAGRSRPRLSPLCGLARRACCDGQDRRWRAGGAPGKLAIAASHRDRTSATLRSAPLAGGQLAVGDRPDPRAGQAANGVAHRFAHAPDLAVAALMERDPRRVRASWETRAGAVIPSSSSTPRRRRPTSSRLSTPSTSTMYSLTTPKLGCVSW